MENLLELTGQESGIVVYYGTGGQPEAVVCNWSSVKGYPRIDPMGLTVLGFGETIPAVDGEAIENISELLDGVEIVYANGEDMPDIGIVYRPEEDILVICPDGWN